MTEGGHDRLPLVSCARYSPSSAMQSAHDHHWVTDRLALGSAVTQGEQVRVLLRERITHVLDCRLFISSPEKVLYEGTGIEILRCGVFDDHRSKPDVWFHQGLDFVVGALDLRRSRVLIHCMAGVSRAPSMTYAVLRALGSPASEAEAKIRSSRAQVQRIRYQADADRALRSWRRGRGGERAALGGGGAEASALRRAASARRRARCDASMRARDRFGRRG
jgi:hypothetical protein